MQHLPGPSQGSPASNPLHNLYPLEWARLNREAVEEMGRETSRDVVFFSRSAAVASPGAAHCFWTGDQLHTWDHLDGLESTVGVSEECDFHPYIK